MKTITLKKAWGKHKAGAELVVLDPGVEWSERAVDPQRADQLEKDGFLDKPKPAAKAASDRSVKEVN